MATSEKTRPHRDERGVKKNEYTRYKEGKDYTKQSAPDMVAMCDMMKRAVFGEEVETVGENGEKVKVRMGRPPKIETVEELKRKAEDYMDYIAIQNQNGACLIPDVEGFALFLGISRVTLYEWVNTRPADFSNTLKAILNAIAAVKKQLALQGKIPPLVFATDFNNNHGYVQQQNVNINAPKKLDELPKKVDIIKRLETSGDIDDGDDLESI